jgi:hypothetical protein
MVERQSSNGLTPFAIHRSPNIVCRKPSSTNQVPHVREAMLATETPDIRECADHADFTDSSNATDCNQPDIRVNVDSGLKEVQGECGKARNTRHKLLHHLLL